MTLNIPEAAEVLGVGRSAAYEMARRGELPVIRIGRRVLIPRLQLERLLGEVPQLTERGPSPPSLPASRPRTTLLSLAPGEEVSFVVMIRMA